jgi:hypothetical protein
MKRVSIAVILILTLTLISGCLTAEEEDLISPQLDLETAERLIDDNHENLKDGVIIDESDLLVDVPETIDETEEQPLLEPPMFSIDDYESYLNYISYKPGFEPHYQLVFALERVTGSV